MRLRGKEKSNEINIDVDMKRTCHTYQTLIHHDFKKGEMKCYNKVVTEVANKI